MTPSLTSISKYQHYMFNLSTLQLCATMGLNKNDDWIAICTEESIELLNLLQKQSLEAQFSNMKIAENRMTMS